MTLHSRTTSLSCERTSRKCETWTIRSPPRGATRGAKPFVAHLARLALACQLESSRTHHHIAQLESTPPGMAATALPGGFASAAASPSSPAFPSHAQSSALNGHGINLALRPGTSFGTSHLASPPSTSVPSFAPTSTGSTDGVDYATLPSWDDTAVALWLAAALPNLATQPHADLFAANDIRGAVLLEVDQGALKEMGVRSVGDRVKICVAIRQLRGKYLAATQLNSGSAGGAAAAAAAGGLSRRPSALGRVAASPTGTSSSRHGSPLAPSSPSALHTAMGPPSLHPNARGGSLSYSARNISVGNRIPPPLHLAQSNAIPSPASSAYLQQQQQRSPPSHATSPRSAVFPPPSSATSTLSSGRREPLPPPSHPPPSGRVPPPPPGAPSPTGWLGDHVSRLPSSQQQQPILPSPGPPTTTGLTSSASQPPPHAHPTRRGVDDRLGAPQGLELVVRRQQQQQPAGARAVAVRRAPVRRRRGTAPLGDGGRAGAAVGRRCARRARARGDDAGVDLVRCKCGVVVDELGAAQQPRGHAQGGQVHVGRRRHDPGSRRRRRQGRSRGAREGHEEVWRQGGRGLGRVGGLGHREQRGRCVDFSLSSSCSRRRSAADSVPPACAQLAC